MRQKTIKVGNEIIRMTARPIVSGYHVIVNNKRFFWAVLTYKEAFDKSFAKYVKVNGLIGKNS